MGVASITGGPRPFNFRIDPNSITWNYSLVTNVEETYGGRVVQLLAVNIKGFSVQADSGVGGYAYLRQVLNFAKDLIKFHQETESSVNFNYPVRGYLFKVQLESMQMRESLDNVTYPFTLNFQVDEDVSGVVTQSAITAELARIRQGIGYTRSKYNTPGGVGNG